MLGWLKSWFAPKSIEQDYALVANPPAGNTPMEPADVDPARQPESLTDGEQRGFLTGLVAPRPRADLQKLAPDDRLFISGVLKKVREQQLDVPMLPQAALRISELLADPNSDARAFAQVLEADPALSVDVLRIANSAYYGFTQQTSSVREAVIRVGLTQLRGLVIVTHLQGRILKGGVFRREAEWVVDLSMAVAQLAQTLAPQLGVGKDEAFTRGVLSHVEHFIIMGSVGDISRDHHKRIQPSRGALLDAIKLCGANVRHLAGQQWQLPGLMDWNVSGGDLAGRYRQLRAVVVADWCGSSPAEVDGVEREAVVKALEVLRRGRAGRTGT